MVRDSTIHDYQSLIWRRLTPELRRTALRRRVWFNCENLTRRREAVSA